jgi:hypothetical protein
VRGAYLEYMAVAGIMGPWDSFMATSAHAPHLSAFSCGAGEKCNENKSIQGAM